MKDLLDVLDTMVKSRDASSDSRDVLLDVGDRIVKVLSAQFRVQPDEVAILMLAGNGKHLRFVAPRQFADLGTIPVTKRDSIAVNILSRKQGEATNNVRMVRHVSFFESVKLRERAAPIQKMITVPMAYEGKPIGVAQISRKGESPSEAGPDFQEPDVRRAEQFFEQVAQYLARARPEKF